METAETSTDKHCAVSGYLDNGMSDKPSSDMEAHLELISKEAEGQRTLRKLALRGKLEGVRAVFKKTLGNGVDPLFVFPEEVWIMIFKHITNLDDLASCARTCRFFLGLVDKDKTEVLFGKVFPLVSTYLDRDEIKPLRQVCKHWHRGVDKCLEGYYSAVTDPPNDIVEVLNDDRGLVSRKIQDFEFRLKIRNDRKWCGYPRTKKEMRRHPGNPFVGRAVKIEVEEPRPEDHNINFFQDFRRMYLEFGEHIWSVSLSDFGASLSLSGVYSLCLQILFGCPNLRSLRIKDFRWLNWSIPNDELERRFNAMPLPPNKKRLVSLEVLIQNRNVFLLQDKLVQKYSRQLKRLVVHFWNTELYHNFNWGNLLELDVLHGNAVELLESLHDTNAPNLKKLSIRLNGSDPWLVSLIHLTHHFTRLSHLHLKFSDGFRGFSDDEIMDIPPNIIASASVTTLEISHSDVKLCYNFLICFPLLKQLVIVKGPVASWRHMLYEDDRTHRRRIRYDDYVEDDLDFNYDVGDLANAVGQLDLLEDDSWMNIEHRVRVHESEEDSSEDEETSEEEDEGDEVDWSSDDGEVEEVKEGVSADDVDDRLEDTSGEETEGQHEILPEEDSSDGDDIDNRAVDNIRGSDDGHQSTSGDSDRSSEDATSESETESEREVVKRSALRRCRWCCSSTFVVKISKRLDEHGGMTWWNGRWVDKYESNVWRILPSLQVLKICIPERYNSPELEKWYVSTRELYDWEQEDQRTRIETRHKLVQRDVAYLKSEIQDVLRHNLRVRRRSILRNIEVPGEDGDSPEDSFDEDSDADSERKFGNALPFMFNYLDRKDLLNCRGVCQGWRSDVDEFLEEFLNVDPPERWRLADKPYTGLQFPKRVSFQFEYTFHIPPGSPGSRSGHDKVMKEMMAHDGNPFIGRTVSIVLTSQIPNHFDKTMRKVCRFLNKFKKDIWHLKMSSGPDFSRIGPVEYYRLIGKILKICRNLRSLNLSHVGVIWPKEKYQVTMPILRLDTNEAHLPSHRNLQSLTVHEKHSMVLTIQERLLRCYRGQLQRLDVTCLDWHGIWNFRKMSVLRELTVPGQQKMESMYIWEGMPELNKLCFRLDEESPNLEPVTILSHYFFHSLEKVELIFGKGCKGFSSDQVASLDTNRICWSPLVTCMELKFAEDAGTSFDFLIYFPYLKRLCIRYTTANPPPPQPDWREDCEHWHSLHFPEKIEPYTSHFIKLDKISGEDGGNAEEDKVGVYASNIWKVLTRLEFLEIECKPAPTLDSPLWRRVYSRGGYECFQKGKFELEPVSSTLLTSLS